MVDFVFELMICDLGVELKFFVKLKEDLLECDNLLEVEYILSELKEVFWNFGWIMLSDSSENLGYILLFFLLFMLFIFLNLFFCKVVFFVVIGCVKKFDCCCEIVELF